MDKSIEITNSKIIISKQAVKRMCIIVWSILIITGLFIVK
ncbi:MAG: Hypothetical protein LKU_02106 [Lactobacillus kefiranofaciens]|uniref:Uncharacterized protein n=1 Tax=Lactobacillus kefiranofaciens TaxID=267818 RepID=A0ABY0MDL3_9LACO|nr:hypothetical protein WANG_1324 [Lactobacillus kefiranofaciens subsp. kefiranofaciens]SDA64829.1 hypothetical protein SAMN02983011_01916 [Lactobacillus kefiranofaciens]